MKIGTCVNFSSPEEIPEKLAVLKENGFDSCQLISWTPSVWTPENAEFLKKCLKQYGITVSAFWCGWNGPVIWNFYDGQLTLGLVPPEYRQMRIQNLCDGADFAHSLGISDVVTHMGFIPENPYDPNFHSFCVAVRTVAQHLKQNGQYLLFETGQETPVTLLRCFETVGMDNLGINLDTANLILYGKANPVDALDVFGLHGVGGNWGAIATGIFAVESMSGVPGLLYGGTDLFIGQLAAVAGISLLVGGIGIMNIMYVSVTERTREIGLRMSIGAKGRDILAQVLIESILISVTGGLIGIVLGIGAAVVVNLAAAFPIYIQPWSVILSFAVCTLTGVFFGWYPAQKAAMLDPIEAIRYE